jgi:hypothetical protein
LAAAAFFLGSNGQTARVAPKMTMLGQLGWE